MSRLKTFSMKLNGGKCTWLHIRIKYSFTAGVSDPVYVDQWGFDPDLFFDDDGKVRNSKDSTHPTNSPS